MKWKIRQNIDFLVKGGSELFCHKNKHSDGQVTNILV